MIKSNQEVTFKTRETYFYYGNLQKLKIARNVFQVFENFLFSRWVA